LKPIFRQIPFHLIRKFLIYYGIWVVLITAGGTIIFDLRERNFAQRLIANKLALVAELISNSYKELLLNRRYQELSTKLISLAHEQKLRVSIIEPEKRVLFDTERPPISSPDEIFRPEFGQALKYGVGKIVRKEKLLKTEMFYLVVPVKDQEKTIALLRIGTPYKKALREFGLPKTRGIFIALMVFLLLGALLVLGKLIWPVVHLNEAIKHYKEGDFRFRLLFLPHDELGFLITALNELGEKLNNLVSSLQTGQEELRTLISALHEGLIVIDGQGKIVLANETFYKIVAQNGPTVNNKYYWQIIADPSFEAIINKLAQNTQVTTARWEHNNRIYLVSGSIIRNSKPVRYILLLNDITEFEKLSERKSEFITNVSHELKTPLSSIKGALETLKEELPKKARPFIKIMERNLERVIKIVDNLILIAFLEQHEISLDTRLVNLRKLFLDLKRLFNEKLKEKRLILKITLEPETQVIMADPFLLEVLFANLLDNAIKYNVERGKIFINVLKENHYVKITVEDTGIGIPQELLPRIFERFYVGDRSRARELGGTGLGLAIVKDIVLRHNGEIKVESKINEGTRFIVTLPSYYKGDKNE
jgi:two-component system phosphate regulon sensor histidine kinase PhoR